MRDCELHIGSDDGIAVWLNGQLVHEIDTHRPYRFGEDRPAVHLHAGVNHILIKLTQFTGGWGFGVGVPKVSF